MDARSFLAPMALVLFVGHMYVHSIPTAGNDLVLVGLLASVGLALGVLGGFATHVRAGADGVALARVGWIAGALLIAGIGVSDGVRVRRAPRCLARDQQLQHRPSDRRRGVAGGTGLDGADRGHARLVTVQLRGRRLTASQAPGRSRSPPRLDHPERCLGCPARSRGPDGVLSSAAVTMTEESASVVGRRQPPAARARASQGRRPAPRCGCGGQRGTLRPLGLALIAVVVVGTFNGTLSPARTGSGLGVAVALAVFAPRWRRRSGLVHRAEHRRSGGGDRGDGRGRRCARGAAAARGDRPGRRCSRVDGGRPFAARRSASRSAPRSRSRSMSRRRWQAAPPRRSSPPRCCARCSA